MTLLRDIEATEWSEDAVALFLSLALFGPTDEDALIVVAAAARLIAATAVNESDLEALLCEFGDVAHSWFARMAHRPLLRVEGGTDAG